MKVGVIVTHQNGRDAHRSKFLVCASGTCSVQSRTGLRGCTNLGATSRRLTKGESIVLVSILGLLNRFRLARRRVGKEPRVLTPRAQMQ